MFDPTFSEPEAGRDRRGLPFNSDHARDIYSRTMDALMQTHGLAIHALRVALLALGIPLTVGVALVTFWWDSMLVGQRGNSTRVLLWALENCRSQATAASLARIDIAALIGDEEVTGFSRHSVTLQALADSKLEAHQSMLLRVVDSPLRALQQRPLLYVVPDGQGGRRAYVVAPGLYAFPGDAPARAKTSGTKENASITHDFTGNLDLMAPQCAGTNFSEWRRDAEDVSSLFLRLLREQRVAVRESLRAQLDARGLTRVTPQLLIAHFRGLATGHLYVMRGCLLHILRLGLWLDFWFWLAEFIARSEGETANGDRKPEGNDRLRLHEARISALKRFTDGYTSIEAIRGAYSTAKKRTGGMIQDGIYRFRTRARLFAAPRGSARLPTRARARRLRQ